MMRSIIKNDKTYYVFGILIILLFWIIGEAHFNNDYIIPSIEQTFISLTELLKSSNTYKVLGYTLCRLIVSVGVCFILAILLASLSLIFGKFNSFIKPIIALFKTLPTALFIVLLLVIFADYSLYFIVGVVVLPIMYEGIIGGFSSVGKDVVDEVKMHSNITLCVISKVYLPIAMPDVITSLIQSFGLGLKVLIMAEIISNAKNCIGYEILLYKDEYHEMSYVYAWSIILICFVLLFDFILRVVKEKKFKLQ